MKKSGIAIALCLLFQTGMCQMDLKELTGLLGLPLHKLENQIQRKGFRNGQLCSGQDYLRRSYIRIEQDRETTIARTIQVVSLGQNCQLIYQTSSSAEFNRIIQEIQQSGYRFSSQEDQGMAVYQKQDLSIESSRTRVDTMELYTLKALKKNLPRLKDIVFAEDLLQLDSHEFLTEVFGKNNVRQDVFFYSAREKDACSILFPNTSREVIFVWKDQKCLREIAFIGVGLSLTNKENSSWVNQQAQNSWQSRQGVFCGMNLRELEKRNGGPVLFYNWQTESAGFLAPGNKGSLDFQHLGIVFGCLNCDNAQVQPAVIPSTQALRESQKVYVNSYIVLPEKNN